MNDTLIENKIKYYLKKQPLFNFSKVKVFVQKGDVTLVGKVSTEREKNFAESIVKGMREINRVTSKLELMSEAITSRLPTLQSVLSQV